MKLGAHESISGGIENAFQRGRDDGCESLQIFTKSERQWSAKPLAPEALDAFRTASKGSGIPLSNVLVHDSYLINLASPDPVKLEKAKAAFVEEIRRCEQLGVRYLVTHPGSHVGSGEDQAIETLVSSYNDCIHRSSGSPVMILLETTAGQGTCMGYRFEQIAGILKGIKDRSRMGVCVDTCHIFAAGYDIRTPEGYEQVMQELDRVIGVKEVRAFHINDSKKELGSRVDRHEEIAEGFIGETAFRCLMNDPRWKDTIGVIETPGEDFAKNLKRLRSYQA